VIVKQSNLDTELLEKFGVFVWPIWRKEVSTFPWAYDSEEACYLLEGDVTVIPREGEPIRLEAGDLVTFPAGMNLYLADSPGGT